MNSYNDILSFMRGGSPNYGGALASIQSLIEAKRKRLDPSQNVTYFGVNGLPVRGNQSVPVFTNAQGYSSFGQPIM